MDRLTERDKHENGIWAKELGGHYTYYEPYDEGYYAVAKLADLEDAIEAGTLVEQKHGKWKPIKVDGMTSTFECSVCQRTVKAGNDYFGAPTKHIVSHYPYCHCGAKMDEVE